MRSRFSIIFSLMCVLMVSSLFSDEKISLIGFRGINTDNEIPTTVRELFRIELTSHGYDIKQPVNYDYCYDVSCVKSLEQYGDLALLGSVTHLGKKYIISIVLYSYSLEKAVHTDQMSSDVIEDLDLVVKRMTEGLRLRRPAKELYSKDNLLLSETNEKRKRRNFYTTGLRVGHTFPIQESFSDRGMITFELPVLYELQKYAIEGKIHIAANSKTNAFGGDVSFLYFMGERDFSTYLVGGVGAQIFTELEVITPDDWEKNSYMISGNGLSLNGGFGFMAYQTYDFRLMVDARYHVTFAGSETVWDLGVAHDLEVGTQHGIRLTFGLTRKINKDKTSSCLGW